MATFSVAYNNTAGHEGGYTVDGGGPTYKGIAFKWHTKDKLAMAIYRIVKAANPRKKQIINNKDLDTMIVAWYKQTFWDFMNGDKINNQTLANFIYDFVMNTNPYTASFLINKAIGSTRGTTRITESTLWQLNDKPAYCYEAIRRVRKANFDKVANEIPKYKKDGTYRGWMARLNSFPKTIA